MRKTLRSVRRAGLPITWVNAAGRASSSATIPSSGERCRRGRPRSPDAVVRDPSGPGRQTKLADHSAGCLGRCHGVRRAPAFMDRTQDFQSQAVRRGLPAGGSRIRTLGPSRAMSPEKVETRRYSGRCVPNVDLQIAVWKRPAAVRDFAVSDTRSSSIPSVSPCPRLRGDRAPTRNGCDKPPQHWSPGHVRGYRRRDD